MTYRQLAGKERFYIYDRMISDWLDILNPAEFKIMGFILNRTVKYKKIAEYVPLKHFTEGVRNAVGPCGYSRRQVIRILDSLKEKGLISFFGSKQRRFVTIADGIRDIINDNSDNCRNTGGATHDTTDPDLSATHDTTGGATHVTLDGDTHGTAVINDKKDKLKNRITSLRSVHVREEILPRKRDNMSAKHTKSKNLIKLEELADNITNTKTNPARDKRMAKKGIDAIKRTFRYAMQQNNTKVSIAQMKKYEDKYVTTFFLKRFPDNVDVSEFIHYLVQNWEKVMRQIWGYPGAHRKRGQGRPSLTYIAQHGQKFLDAYDELTTKGFLKLGRISPEDKIADQSAEIERLKKRLREKDQSIVNLEQKFIRREKRETRRRFGIKRSE